MKKGNNTDKIIAGTIPSSLKNKYIGIIKTTLITEASMLDAAICFIRLVPCNIACNPTCNGVINSTMESHI